LGEEGDGEGGITSNPGAAGVNEGTLLLPVSIIIYISSIESCQRHNTQMSIMSNVLNKPSIINTTRNTMAADLYAPKKS